MAKKNKKKRAAPRSTAAAAPAARAHPTRAERLEMARRERRRRALRMRLALWAGLAVLVVGVAGVVVRDRVASGDRVATLESGTCNYDERSDADAGSGRNHISDPSYRVDPPAGGDHTVEAAPPGVYSGGATPSDGQVVHALEHGYVVLWHTPELAGKQFEALNAVREAFRRDVLVVARPGMAVPVAATAWHQRLLCDRAEGDVLREFVRTSRNKGPEKVKH